MTDGPAKTGTIFQLSGVSLAFGDEPVLRGLDLSLDRSELLSLVGPSGCGKSVLLKTMIGLLTPQRGAVLFEGNPIAGMSARALLDLRVRVGMVFQYGALFESMTVGENVAYGLYEHYRRTMTEAQIRERVRWALTSVALPGVEHLKPSELSGGMRKRVAVARTVALRPEVLLYDEPTMGLDPQNTTRIGRLIARLHQQLGICTVLVTHDMRLAAQISQRIAMLEEGRILAEGTPAQMHAHANPHVREFVAVRGAHDAAR